jgi:hypothetical protein
MSSFPPMIPWPQLPESEREAARHISEQIHHLGFYVTLFQQGLQLVQYASRLRAQLLDTAMSGDNWGANDLRFQAANWKSIAARDAAMNIYHFQSILRSLRDQTKDSPWVRARVETKVLEEAYDAFKIMFPSWKEMRHVIGHTADMMFSPAEKKKHYPENGPVFVSMYDGDGDRLTMTRGKQAVYVDMTPETLNGLTTIKEAVWRAFRKCDGLP